MTLHEAERVASLCVAEEGHAATWEEMGQSDQGRPVGTRTAQHGPPIPLGPCPVSLPMGSWPEENNLQLSFVLTGCALCS